MTTQTDPRVAELEALAENEGIRLPFPVDYILFLEDHGRMVDLLTGEVIYSRLVATPTPSTQAVCYLLGHVVGEVVL